MISDVHIMSNCTRAGGGAAVRGCIQAAGGQRLIHSSTEHALIHNIYSTSALTRQYKMSKKKFAMIVRRIFNLKKFLKEKKKKLLQQWRQSFANLIRQSWDVVPNIEGTRKQS